MTPGMIEFLAAALGVTATSLTRLGIGWAFDAAYRRGPKSPVFDAGDLMRISAANAAYSFPMTDASGNVLGIRIRSSTGEKWSVTGGHEGLFIPHDLPRGGELLITEGPTDCAALLDLGFAATGRPSCTGGVKLLVELARRRKPSTVTIVADGDEPGQRGANALATVLAVYVRRLRIITPPIEVKDARTWKQAGATVADVRAAIDAAPIRQLNISGRKAKEQGHE
jgi:5S rRNA maturation endonuclease (ribonuclease M5)